MNAKLTTVHSSIEKLNSGHRNSLSFGLGQAVPLIMSLGRINWVYLGTFTSASAYSMKGYKADICKHSRMPRKPNRKARQLWLLIERM
jgi:hypothetical protein